jgi:riboflavin transporter FmnP
MEGWRMAEPRSKVLASTALFTALTLALNLSPIKFPAPFAPFLYYQIWEIPIVAALLIYGLKVGAAVTIINTAALIALFPGALPTGPLYNMVAVLSMLLAIYAIVKMRGSASNLGGTTLILSTLLGIVSRVVVMTIMNYALIRYPPPLGFSMPEESILVLLPLIAAFNATLALYTIPIGYLVAKAVASKIQIVGQNNLKKLEAKL